MTTALWIVGYLVVGVIVARAFAWWAGAFKPGAKSGNDAASFAALLVMVWPVIAGVGLGAVVVIGIGRIVLWKGNR